MKKIFLILFISINLTNCDTKNNKDLYLINNNGPKLKLEFIAEKLINKNDFDINYWPFKIDSFILRCRIQHNEPINMKNTHLVTIIVNNIEYNGQNHSEITKTSKKILNPTELLLYSHEECRQLRIKAFDNKETNESKEIIKCNNYSEIWSKIFNLGLELCSDN